MTIKDRNLLKLIFKIGFASAFAHLVLSFLFTEVDLSVHTLAEKFMLLKLPVYMLENSLLCVVITVISSALIVFYLQKK